MLWPVVDAERKWTGTELIPEQNSTETANIDLK